MKVGGSIASGKDACHDATFAAHTPYVSNINKEVIMAGQEPSKNTAAWVLKQIADGSIDPYLRAVVETIKERRSALGAEGLPEQQTVTVADWQPHPTDQPKAVKFTGASKPGFFHKDHRPDPSLKPTTQRWSQCSPNDPNAIVLPGIGTYDRHQIVGQCILTNLGGSMVAVQVVGLGPKTVKVLLVQEPPRGTYHGKKELHTIWDSNTPIFLAHSILTPYLNK